MLGDILWHSVARIMNALVAGGHCTYETQKLGSVFHHCNNSLDSETHHPSENCVRIFSIHLDLPFQISISQYPIPWIIFQRLPSSIVWLSVLLPGNAAPGVPRVSSCICSVAHFTMLIIHHWWITASRLFEVYIHEFRLGIKLVLLAFCGPGNSTLPWPRH